VYNNTFEEAFLNILVEGGIVPGALPKGRDGRNGNG
jgi:hypothetical protein